jgi:hypothetical protein
MKRAFLTTIFFVLSNCLFAQNFNDRHPAILSFVKSVNSKLTIYKEVKLSSEELVDQQMDGGAELTGYFNNDGTIQKIIISVGYSYGYEQIEFYFKDSELYYANETFSRYKYLEDEGTFDYSKTEPAFNGQYLFTPAFDYETMGHNRFENDEFDPQTVLEEEAKDYRTKLMNKYNR